MGDDVDIVQQNRPSLTEAVEPLSPAQLHACLMIAEYKPPQEILDASREQFGDDAVSLTWAYRASSPVKRPHVFQRAIEAIRACYREMTDEPIMDPAWRMRQRRRIVEQAIEAGNYDQARETLADVERLGGAIPHQQPAGVQNNILIDLGDISEARKRVENMKADAGGKAPIWPAGTPKDVIDGDET